MPMLLTGASPVFARMGMGVRSGAGMFLRAPSKPMLGSSRTGVRMASSSAPGATQTQTPSLTWDQFFKLRQKRRTLGTVSSIFTAAVASGLAFSYFANLPIDFNKTFMGIEIQWIYLGGIVISGFAGWLVGPALGNQVFKIVLGSRQAIFREMDDVFLRHIARNRPDPSRHNVNHNPLSDYYGEKIGSVRDYRQWLREGRLFMKKAEKFL